MGGFNYAKQVERWSLFEASCEGVSEGNPFVERHIKGIFESRSEKTEADGFYDGGGIYRVRFMPSFAEKYTFTISGNFSDKTYSGEFEAYTASEGNHGPVRVANTYHFAYEDGTPYYPVGTTCYAWTHGPEERQEQTLKTLSEGYFNKIRFCVFPKHYDYNLKDPVTFPYEGTPVDSSLLTKENFNSFNGSPEGNNWDFFRFNPAHFRNIERRIGDLMKLGIEADLIVMHPYDRWGFSEMTAGQDDLYWKYVIARFAAYRNVWWSLANEYDLMRKKTLKDWERYASIILEKDPYSRLRSIHNCSNLYDHSRPWITHCCIQRVDAHKTSEFTAEWRERYGKPVVLDEIAYEGNINHCWGNISAKELTRRFWEAAVRGGYAGHGETYMHPDDVLWWSHGGVLHGESHERIKFLHKILLETPGIGLSRINQASGMVAWDDSAAMPCEIGYRNSYYLFYFGNFRPSFRIFRLDAETEYEVEIIDTWNMVIMNAGRFKGTFRVELPGREYMAVRIRKV